MGILKMECWGKREFLVRCYFHPVSSNRNKIKELTMGQVKKMLDQASGVKIIAESIAKLSVLKTSISKGMPADMIVDCIDDLGSDLVGLAELLNYDKEILISIGGEWINKMDDMARMMEKLSGLRSKKE